MKQYPFAHGIQQGSDHMPLEVAQAACRSRRPFPGSGPTAPE